VQPGQPAPPQQQMQQVPVNPSNPPDPKAIAVAKFLRSQNLKSRTCILDGQRKDMFKGTLPHTHPNLLEY
jgi:translocation protein SEC62